MYEPRIIHVCKAVEMKSTLLQPMSTTFLLMLLLCLVGRERSERLSERRWGNETMGKQDQRPGKVVE